MSLLFDNIMSFLRDAEDVIRSCHNLALITSNGCSPSITASDCTVMEKVGSPLFSIV